MGARIRLTGCEVDLDQRRVVRAEGDVALGRIEAALLRVLAEHVGTDVHRDTLLREVWGEDAGARTVDFAVRRLREKLGEPDPPRHLLTSHGVGYRLVPLDFAGTRPAPAAATRHRLRTATGRIDLDERWVEVDGQRLDLTRVESALLDRLAASLGTPVPVETLVRELWGRGRHLRSLTAALGRLRRKIERDPSHPSVIVTVRNVGVRLLAEPDGDAPPPRTQVTNLPADGPFVLRPEAQWLRDHAERPLVTLVGPAGVGKTRLARHVARALLDEEQLDEVWFCDLAAAFDADGVTRVVARTLRVRVEAPSGDAVGGALASRSAVGRVLVILDNFEQVAGASPRVAGWIAAAPGLRVWVTSRVALGLAQETVLAVAPLEEDAAVALFEARSAGPLVRAEVRALVRRLDGLPLAIELAAARSGQLPPPVMLARIEDRLELLVRPPDGLVSHHSTLRGAVDWSWDLLGAEDRATLATLSVVLSPFDAALAEALAGPGAARSVQSLVLSSLLIRRPDGACQMLEAIRAYALEKLHISGRWAEATERRAAVLLDLAERAARDLDGSGGREASEVLGALHDDLLDIHRTTADPDRAMRAAIALGRAANHAGWSPRVVAALREALDRGASRALVFDGWVTLGTVPHVEAQALDAIDTLAETERERAVASRMRSLDACARRSPGYIDQLMDARRALLAAGEPRMAARLLGTVGWLADVSLARHRELLEQALAEMEALQDVAGRAVIRHHLAEIALHWGRFDEVDGHVRAGLEDAARTGTVRTALRLRHVEGVVASERGQLCAAEAGLVELERDCVQAGFPDLLEVVRWERAALALLADRPELTLDLMARHPAATWTTPNVNAAVAEMLTGQWAQAAARLGGIQEAGSDGRIAWYSRAYRAVALAAAGDVAGARLMVDGLASTLDPNIDGVARLAALCAAAVAVCEDPGTQAAPARALIAAGERILCDDGEWRERPADVQLARLLLERVLGRVAAAPG